MITPKKIDLINYSKNFFFQNKEKEKHAIQLNYNE